MHFTTKIQAVADALRLFRSDERPAVRMGFRLTMPEEALFSLVV